MLTLASCLAPVREDLGRGFDPGPDGGARLDAGTVQDAGSTLDGGAVLDGGACSGGRWGFGRIATFWVPSPSHLATGDLDGDGKLDLVVTNEVAGTVTVLLGSGDNSFRTASTFPVGLQPVNVLVVDLDHDGALDLVVTNTGGGNISVLPGRGDGTFGAQWMFPAGALPDGPQVADFDHDGRLDLAIGDVGDDSVGVLLGNSTSWFTAPRFYPAGEQAVCAGVADFDADGTLDLVVTDPSRLRPTGTVSLLLGNGDGTFRPARTFETGTVHPIGCVVADFDHDGRPDVATVSQFVSQRLTLLLNDGAGGFLPARTFPVGAGSSSIVAGDLDLDGHLDLAVANATDRTVSLLMGRGDGTFESQQVLDAGATSVAVAHLDDSCLPELLIADVAAGSVSVFRSPP